VKVPGGRCIANASSSPTICAGIVSPAGVQIVARANKSAPNDHFITSPHRLRNTSRRGRVGGAGGCPTVGTGIVSSASVSNVRNG
jgi:hypothetical protein